ncbi:hypothetical protein DFH06DRAFT_1328433 [Mycena polygramma]|nr:hypothetical protein DFH06DRAFT_1328433 [Mycena polygramma]
MPQNVDLSAVYSPPYSAFTHDGARHRGPIRARRPWAGEKLIPGWILSFEGQGHEV